MFMLSFMDTVIVLSMFTITWSVNDNINMDSTITGSVDDKINMDSTITG
jgi:hypothetical protein